MTSISFVILQKRKVKIKLIKWQEVALKTFKLL